ncbi:MAG: radical SAM protein [Kiritimatiellae bacterium]|nr:radical SAM protein [Kiritimatiellia bacterium]
MLDIFNRDITYLRISVTDRCNHRCVYCMPEAGVALKTHANILSYEQIETFVRTAAEMGISKVRLTGGEPLVRKNIEQLVYNLSKINGITELCMTTNGVYLTEKAQALKTAGLNRVNISIDTLDSDKYRRITRCGDLSQVLKGIDSAIKADLTPIKLNMVIFEDTTEQEVKAMQNFCTEKGLSLQKITRFSLYDRHDLINRFHAERPPQCSACNRLRLTSDGFLKPCLFSEDEIKVDFDNIYDSIVTAIGKKPESGSACRSRRMNQIGG